MLPSQLTLEHLDRCTYFNRSRRFVCFPFEEGNCRPLHRSHTDSCLFSTYAVLPLITQALKQDFPEKACPHPQSLKAALCAGGGHTQKMLSLLPLLPQLRCPSCVTVRSYLTTQTSVSTSIKWTQWNSCPGIVLSRKWNNGELALPIMSGAYRVLSKWQLVFLIILFLFLSFLPYLKRSVQGSIQTLYLLFRSGWSNPASSVWLIW